MPQQLPAVSLVAVPGRRQATIELAREIERRGFAGIYCASLRRHVGLCEALALATDAHPVRHRDRADLLRAPSRDFAQSAALPPRALGRPLPVRRRASATRPCTSASA